MRGMFVVLLFFFILLIILDTHEARLGVEIPT